MYRGGKVPLQAPARPDAILERARERVVCNRTVAQNAAQALAGQGLQAADKACKTMRLV